jgi:hypothetical protein
MELLIQEEAEAVVELQVLQEYKAVAPAVQESL